MSGLAKVFLVINVILTILFLGTAATLFSVRKDWKAQSLELEQAYETKAKEQLEDVKKLETSLGAWTSVASAQIAEITDLYARNKKLTDDLASTSQSLAKVTTERDNKDALLKQRETELTGLSGQVSSLTTKFETATKTLEEANETARKMRQVADGATMDAGATMDELAATMKERETLRLENEQLKIKIDLCEKGYPGGEGTTPTLKGKILGVQDDLVVLSLGKDDKVEPGMVFAVSRGSTYLGDITIKQVYKDMSGGQIVYIVEGAQIREGDDAETKRT
jgi:hypothetical protein